MENKELDDLYALADDVTDVLELDDDELKDMMKNNPDGVVELIQHGYRLLLAVLTETINELEK